MIIVGSGLYLWTARPLPLVASAAGVMLVVLDTLFPRLLRMIQRISTKVGIVVGSALSLVILFVVYLFVMTPIGILRRLTGSDPLRRRAGESVTYWSDYSHRQSESKHFEKMY